MMEPPQRPDRAGRLPRRWARGRLALVALALLLLFAGVGTVAGLRVRQHVTVVDRGMRAAEQAVGDPSLPSCTHDK